MKVSSCEADAGVKEFSHPTMASIKVLTNAMKVDSQTTRKRGKESTSGLRQEGNTAESSTKVLHQVQAN